MSLNALAAARRSGPSPILPRLAVAAGAVAAAGLVLGLVGLAVSSAVAPAAPKNPFGTGLREAAPGMAGFGGWLLAVQSEFQRSLVAALSAVRRDGASPWTLLLFGFAYGIFHAAGPGHGKGIIASYIVASRKTLARGVALSTAAAALQALVAIGLVGILTVVLRAGASSINAAASGVERLSFAALLTFGLALSWRKAGAVLSTGHGAGCGPYCGHAHGVGAAEAARATGLWEAAYVVAAAGLRPCSGAIILLVFALSQGLLATGVAAVLAMAAGTALTTGSLAALAVGAKGIALRLAAGRPGAGERALAWLELGAAAFAAALGGTLLVGTWGAGLAS